MLWFPFMALCAVNLFGILVTLRLKTAPIEGALKTRFTMICLFALSIAALELPTPLAASLAVFSALQLGLLTFTAVTFLRWRRRPGASCT